MMISAIKVISPKSQGRFPEKSGDLAILRGVERQGETLELGRRWAFRSSPRGAIDASPFVSLLALLLGDGDKTTEMGATKADPGSAARKESCTCSKKPCACQKGELSYAFLHASGNWPPASPGLGGGVLKGGWVVRRFGSPPAFGDFYSSLGGSRTSRVVPHQRAFCHSFPFEVRRAPPRLAKGTENRYQLRQNVPVFSFSHQKKKKENMFFDFTQMPALPFPSRLHFYIHSFCIAMIPTLGNQLKSA